MSPLSKHAARGLIALTGLLIVAGCSRGLLTAPETEALPTPPAAPSAQDTLAPPPNRLATPSGLISRTLSNLSALDWVQVCQVLVRRDEQKLVAASRYSLQFEKGSLASDAMITIKEYDPDVLDFQLGPHGTQFPVPVELSIDFKGTAADPGAAISDGCEPVLYWLNDRTNRWEEVPGRTDWANRRHIVRLEHFSRYVVGGKAGWKQRPPRSDGN